MTKQHTPGPWYIDCQNESAAIGYRAIVDNEGYTICNPSPMGQADARLIAAAPDLLAALENMVSHFPHWAAQIDMKQIDRDAVGMARAAIAKSTGEA